MTYFQKTLKKLMDDKGLNQLKLAGEINIRQSQVHNWLAGKSLPGYLSIRKLAQYFNVSCDVIVGRDEE